MDWSDESVSGMEPTQDDLGLVLLCCFIFGKRTRDGPPSVDEGLETMGKWMESVNKLRTDVDACHPVILDFSDPDINCAIDVLNMYSPGSPLKFIFRNAAHALTSKKLRVQSPSTYTYEGSRVDVPILHGGKIEVLGDVCFESISDLLSNNNLAMTTEINVTGDLSGCTKEQVEASMRSLRDILYSTKDGDLFRFSITGSSQHIDVDPVFVRKWVIRFTNGPRSCLSVTNRF